LLTKEAIGGKKQVAAPESIFYKFIILQAFPQEGPGTGPGVDPALVFAPFSLGYTQTDMSVTTPLDLFWTGQPRCIASALLQSENSAFLIDPGPGSTLETLREQLQAHGLRVTDLQGVLLTHIHLDHAGATGQLVQEHPELQIYVHERGAPHMVDPANLMNSAGRLYGAEMNRLFGNFLPVPKDNLRVLRGGETLSLGSFDIQVLYTPGHASHHVTYFDPAGKVAFVGDTAGICVEGHPFILPATPPPDIDLDAWAASLHAIEQLQPQRLFLTHFGFADQPIRHLATYKERLQHWANLSAEILSRIPEETRAMQAFARTVSEEAAAYLSPVELSHYLFNGALNLSWLGLARYQRKRQEGKA
jgi:glyoxylase-like metal-dependent hydrolase (beta-lactamase superfamily II)